MALIRFRAVREAIGCGYRHIDTAQLCGNEESVGKGIKESGLNRSELFVHHEAEEYGPGLRQYPQGI